MSAPNEWDVELDVIDFVLSGRSFWRSLIYFFLSHTAWQTCDKELHVYKLNEASKVTLMSIDIPQCKQFYVFIVTSAMLLISVHYIFSSGFFPFIQRGGGARRGRGKGEMSRVRIDRHTNICSPTVFLCLKHSFFLPHHKWLRLVWNSNLRMFFWLIQKRAIYICCGI